MINQQAGQPLRLAIVSARYGAEVAGGAEGLARGLARAAAAHGWRVNVLTTCAKSFDPWQDSYPAGVFDEDGVTVERFPVSARGLRDDPYTHYFSPEEQVRWLLAGEHSNALIAALRQQAHRFDYIVILPYLSTISYLAAQVAPLKTLYWPCFHDEIYAYFTPFQRLVPELYALLFNSPEERWLALNQLGLRPQRHATIGIGVEQQPSASVDLPKHPYLLYTGRLEQGKQVRLLYDYMQRLNAESATHLSLVIAGDGPQQPPAALPFDQRGFVSTEIKMGLMSAAIATCQLSVNESFSLVLMESWLAGRPVIVNARCPTTVGQVMRSRGGLWVNSYSDFAAAVEWLQSHPEQATRMGQNGRRYVERNFSWQQVLTRLERALLSWQTK